MARAIASSADGSRLAAVGAGSPLLTSIGDRTTAGVGGSLSGAQYDAITLQYLDGGVFMPLNHLSYSGSFDIR